MSVFSPADSAAPQTGMAGHRTTLFLFTGALFVSAFLLFGVQPMFTKMVLPILGGTPAVWSVAMVFFQALLLAGYCYAHLLVRHLGLRQAALVHLALMGLAFVALPIGIAEGWGRPPAAGEAVWLLGLFAVSVGLPFFAVSANGPLLQAWFARSGHPQARDPYFLYAASNIGSFASLAAYPILIEPGLSLRQQSAGWTMGFVLLAALIAACAFLAGRGARMPIEAAPVDDANTIGWRQRLRWVALAFVPSGLLVAVTAHIATDIASAPLLWVVPLALFLLTFVLAFRDSPYLSSPMMTRLLVWTIGIGIFSFALVLPLWIGLPTHLGLFFLVALSAHNALYRSRPDASRLTEFYLWMSLGGVLGGAFCGLVAPHIFSFVVEYPLLLLAGLLCRKEAASILWEKRREALIVLALALAGLAAFWSFGYVSGRAPEVSLIAAATLVLLTMAMWRRPEKMAPFAAVAIVAAMLAQSLIGGTTTVRSFFGVHKVVTTTDGRFRLLKHGTTMHGGIRIANDDGTPVSGRPESITYYTPGGGISQAFRSIRAARGGTLPRVGVVGLGSGSLACHIEAAESWTFFEIDPHVVDLARNPTFFRFLRDCPPTPVSIVLGDARLTIADDPGGLDAIMMDGFSSDAIPAHLITSEAIGLYLRKLAPSGALIIHISNRYLDVRHILARAGAEHGLSTYVLQEKREEPLEKRYRAPTTVAVLARDPAHLGPIASNPAWQRIEPDPTRRPWTDDYSNIIEALIDRARR